MAEDVLPPHRCTDDIEVVVALICEQILAELDHRAVGRHILHARALPSATARIAAMMGS